MKFCFIFYITKNAHYGVSPNLLYKSESLFLKVEHGSQLLNEFSSASIFIEIVLKIILVRGLNFSWQESKAGPSSGLIPTRVTTARLFASATPSFVDHLEAMWSLLSTQCH